MGNPYTSQSISQYNANPPPDDGSTGANNETDWSMVKTKLGDPVKTLAEAINTELQASFQKVLGGNGVTSTAVNYTVLSADQGKMVRATAASITITTPDATVVGAPFVFALNNNSTGTITLDGNGAQNIDGVATATVAAGAGMVIFTDGTNWFTTGQQGILVGSQLTHGTIINGTLVEADAANAVTFSLKTQAGNTPTAADPVLITFRTPSPTFDGTTVFRQVTAATTLTISSGSTLGATNGVAFRVWLVLFDDAGTVRLGAINCVSGTNIFPLARGLCFASSTAEGGAGGADSAQVFYTGTAVSGKAYVVLGYASYESGLATAGTWNVGPSNIALSAHGVAMPGTTIQTVSNFTGASTTGTTAIPYDDTIPQSGEGDQYMTQAITPMSASNLLRIEVQAELSNSNATTNTTGALFQDSATDATTADVLNQVSASGQLRHNLKWVQRAATTSSTTFKYRAGGSTGATTTFNGGSGNRKLGGVLNSYMIIDEIQT